MDFLSRVIFCPVFLNSVTQLCRHKSSQSGSFHLVRAEQTETQLRGGRRHGRHGHTAAETERATYWYEMGKCVAELKKQDVHQDVFLVDFTLSSVNF